MSSVARSLSDNANTTSFTPQQNRSVLIAGLTCACFSVLATLITLRWFMLMKRTFRHKLVMFLIISDSFKAFWYFLFPIVVFSRGSVRSSSKFCQASGFFLALGIEASDFAILMIALHSIIYIFHPPARAGDSGGLYKWRKFIYPCWLGFPLLAASLAFINDQNAYTTTGTVCYLPRRPFWYRLALAWIPRYCILLLIFGMYTAVYIYVALKFRSFSHLQESESNYSSTSRSRRTSISADDIAPDEVPRSSSFPASPKKSASDRLACSRTELYNNTSRNLQESSPWDEVSFITSKPLRNHGSWQASVQAPDFGKNEAGLDSVNNTIPLSGQDSLPVFNALSPFDPASRKVSNCATTNSQLTGDTMTTSPPDPQSRQLPQAGQNFSSSLAQTTVKDPLKRTRKAIRKQLRYLFIYPAVYVLMWIFPFASHCLLYNDYYVHNPVYWLTIVSTCMLSLQAGADCVVFSWREKPWRRMSANHGFSLRGFRSSFSARRDTAQDQSGHPSIAIAPDEETATTQTDWNGFASGQSSRATSAHWWEAEGRKRQDSVWMGTDTANGNEPNPGRRDTVAQMPSVPILPEVDETDHRTSVDIRKSPEHEEKERRKVSIDREQDAGSAP